MRQLLCLAALLFASAVQAAPPAASEEANIEPLYAPGNEILRPFTQLPPKPSFPQAALQERSEATVVAHIKIDEQCKYAGISFVVHEITTGGVKARFERAIEQSLANWAPECKPGFNRAFTVEVPYMFLIRPQVRNIYRIKREQITLTEFLTLIDKPTTAGAEINNVHAHCPNSVVLTPMMPHAPNRVRRWQGNGMQGMSEELVQWLKQLKMDRTYRFDLLASPIKIEIPCAKIKID